MTWISPQNIFRKITMKRQEITRENRKQIIAKSDWKKKKLADVHVEGDVQCQFNCRYCSSNAGLHLRFDRKLKEQVQAETGAEFDPHHADNLRIKYADVVGALEKELDATHKRKGAGQTLVYSQLTDGFAPDLLKDGTTRKILDLIIEKTAYRVRILTKSAAVGQKKWINFFQKHPDRFVVGLSIGTLDDALAKRVEKDTSTPTARVRALHALQDAGVATYGMLCPVLPTVLQSDELERLVEAVRPDRCEHVWAEPYNDRDNWRVVQEYLPKKTWLHGWLSEAYETQNDLWSEYATTLYERLLKIAERDCWTDKLRYLLYESDISTAHVDRFAGLTGVLLQSKVDRDTGLSKHAGFAAFQRDLQESASS